jgi:hypothetical protein
MRPLFLSLGACLLVFGIARSQATGDGGSMPQLPVGQTFKQFQFPVYQGAVLKSTLTATEATGITLNRAETTDLKIEIYDNGVVTTTVTSPKADLYVNEQKMRTKNTVQIERSDMEATSQDCDFDLKSKKYLLRTNVKVILKNFDVSMNPAKNGAQPPASAPAQSPAGATPPLLTPISPRPERNESLLDSPGSYADTNSAPIPPPSSETK